MISKPAWHEACTVMSEMRSQMTQQITVVEVLNERLKRRDAYIAELEARPSVEQLQAQLQQRDRIVQAHQARWKGLLARLAACNSSQGKGERCGVKRSRYVTTVSNKSWTTHQHKDEQEKIETRKVTRRRSIDTSSSVSSYASSNLGAIEV